MTTTTATFREYAEDNGSQYLIVNTGYVTPYPCRISVHTAATVQTVELLPDTARILGTSLIHWASNPSLHTLEPAIFHGVHGRIQVEVADGEVTVSINDGPELTFDFEGDAIDLGQRLIVFAGVNLPSRSRR